MGPPSCMLSVVDRNVVMWRMTKWQNLWLHIIRRTMCALWLVVPSVRMEQVISYIRYRSGQELAGVAVLEIEFSHPTCNDVLLYSGRN
jgi:hypothetical protein